MGPSYLKAVGIYYANELKSIPKSSDFLQPIFEAFRNSWDTISTKYGSGHMSSGKIELSLHYINDNVLEGIEKAPDEIEFTQIKISDNGEGLNEKNYSRLLNLRDDSKGPTNKGTGRIQYVHFFKETIIDSIYLEESKNINIQLTMSKDDIFLKHNAIFRLDSKEETKKTETGTVITLNNVLDKKKDYPLYRDVSIEQLKNEIIIHFLPLLCENRSNLPQISISKYINDTCTEPITIAEKDIPNFEKEEKFSINYSSINDDNKIELSEKTENFTLLSFKLHHIKQQNNELYFVSHGALATKNEIDTLPPKDNVDGYRYLFLLSSPYFDKIDDDQRGVLHLVKELQIKKQLKEGNTLFPEEFILADTIKESVNERINSIYPAFAENHDTALKNLDRLKEMFLIDESAIEKLKKKIKYSDSDEDILSTLYKADIDITAKRDAEIKNIYEGLKELDPAEHDYQNKLSQQIETFVKLIPLQNRTSLTKYVARRRLVLEIFNMVLNNELNKLKNGERIDEKILHNLIFKQHSNNPKDSNLWILDDSYIYFQGSSEKDFNHLKIGDDLLMKSNDELSDEEQDYKERSGRIDTGLRRPDVLLFPEEGKCIIIEFKAPNVDVSKHLQQINRYAMMLRNLSVEKFNLTSFYGYLIGENIDYRDIEENDSAFVEAPYLHYFVRPYYRVNGKFGRKDGSLYTEIIKYSDIYKRAKMRNQIFLEKLENEEKKSVDEQK